MAEFITGREFGVAVCHALGLDPSRVARVVIDAPADGVVMVYVEEYGTRALLDVLDEKHDFPLPPKMVEAEFNAIWQQVQADKERGGLPPEDAEKSDDQLQTEYRKIAERRVRLGLVLAEIGRINNVQVTDQELLDAMRQEAMRYGQQAQQIFDMFRQNAGMQAQLRAPIFEDKVVDLIVEKATVTDEKVSKDDLLKEDDMPEGYSA